MAAARSTGKRSDMATWTCDLEDSMAMDVRSAANCGELQVLLEAAERGDDVTWLGGWTALMYACGRQSSAAVVALLRLGADVDARDRRGQTALMQASKLGDEEIVRELLAAGAEPRRQDLEGRSALCLAAAWGQSRTLELLLGADVPILASLRGALDPVDVGRSRRKPKDLRALLEAEGLVKYAHTFTEKGVDLRAFLAMSEEDLRDMGIRLVGPRRKMTLAITKWRNLA